MHERIEFNVFVDLWLWGRCFHPLKVASHNTNHLWDSHTVFYSPNLTKCAPSGPRTSIVIILWARNYDIVKCLTTNWSFVSSRICSPAPTKNCHHVTGEREIHMYIMYNVWASLSYIYKQKLRVFSQLKRKESDLLFFSGQWPL